VVEAASGVDGMGNRQENIEQKSKTISLIIPTNVDTILRQEPVVVDYMGSSCGRLWKVYTAVESALQYL
jgi:hypothetical protein